MQRVCNKEQNVLDYLLHYIRVFQNSPNMLKTNQPSKKEFD